MKILDNGIAVLEGDSHIGRWVQESGRIDHDLTVEKHILPMFKPEWHVLDVGADVGSHTVRYAERAARVTAFEPNRDEFACLVWNCRHLPNVTCLPLALGNQRDLRSLKTCENAGAGYLDPHEAGPVMVVTLDSLPWERLDFLKIDVEGYEMFVLGGAYLTIRRYKPIILMEMNAGALDRYGYSYTQVFAWLAHHGYTWRSFAQDVDLNHEPQYDLLATPKARE